MACASCHFHSGADSRTKNTLHPKADGLFDDFLDGTGPNLTMKKDDFPFAITGGHDGDGVDDPMGSGGVHKRAVANPDARLQLSTAKAHMLEDKCENVPDLIWHVNYINVRRETGRNTPTTYNALFALDNFWMVVPNGCLTGWILWADARGQ